MERPSSPRMGFNVPSLQQSNSSSPVSSPRRMVLALSQLKAAEKQEPAQRASLVQQHLQRFKASLQESDTPIVHSSRHKPKTPKDSVDIRPQLRAMGAITHERIVVDSSSMLGPRPSWHDCAPHVPAPPLVQGEYIAKLDRSLRRAKAAAAGSSRNGLSNPTAGGGGGGASTTDARRWGRKPPSSFVLWSDIAELRGSRRLRAYIAGRKREGEAPLKLLIDEAHGWDQLRERQRHSDQDSLAAAASSSVLGSACGSVSVTSASGGSAASAAASTASAARSTAAAVIAAHLPSPSAPVVYVSESDWTTAAAAAAAPTEAGAGTGAAETAVATMRPKIVTSNGHFIRTAPGPARPAPTSVVLVHFPRAAAAVGPSSEAPTSPSRMPASAPASVMTSASTASSTALPPARRSPSLHSFGSNRLLPAPPPTPPSPPSPRQQHKHRPNPPHHHQQQQQQQYHPQHQPQCHPQQHQHHQHPHPQQHPHPHHVLASTESHRSVSSNTSTGSSALSATTPPSRSLTWTVSGVSDSSGAATAATAAGFVPGIERYHTTYTLPSQALATLAHLLSPRTLVGSTHLVEVVEVLHPPRILRSRLGGSVPPSPPIGGGGSTSSLSSSSSQSRAARRHSLADPVSWAERMRASIASSSKPVVEGLFEVLSKLQGGPAATTEPPHSPVSTAASADFGDASPAPIFSPSSPNNNSASLTSTTATATTTTITNTLTPTPSNTTFAAAVAAAVAANIPHCAVQQSPRAASTAATTASPATATAVPVIPSTDLTHLQLPAGPDPASAASRPEPPCSSSRSTSFPDAVSTVLRLQRWRRLAASPGTGTQIDPAAFARVSAVTAEAAPARSLGLVPALATSASQVVVRTGGSAVTKTTMTARCDISAAATATAAAAVMSGGGVTPPGPVTAKRMRSLAAAQLQRKWSLGARAAAAGPTSASGTSLRVRCGTLTPRSVDNIVSTECASGSISGGVISGAVATWSEVAGASRVGQSPSAAMTPDATRVRGVPMEWYGTDGLSTWSSSSSLSAALAAASAAASKGPASEGSVGSGLVGGFGGAIPAMDAIPEEEGSEFGGQEPSRHRYQDHQTVDRHLRFESECSHLHSESISGAASESGCIVHQVHPYLQQQKHHHPMLVHMESPAGLPPRGPTRVLRRQIVVRASSGSGTGGSRDSSSGGGASTRAPSGGGVSGGGNSLRRVRSLEPNSSAGSLRQASLRRLLSDQLRMATLVYGGSGYAATDAEEDEDEEHSPQPLQRQQHHPQQVKGGVAAHTPTSTSTNTPLRISCGSWTGGSVFVTSLPPDSPAESAAAPAARCDLYGTASSTASGYAASTGSGSACISESTAPQRFSCAASVMAPESWGTQSVDSSAPPSTEHSWGTSTAPALGVEASGVSAATAVTTTTAGTVSPSRQLPALSRSSNKLQHGNRSAAMSAGVRCMSKSGSVSGSGSVVSKMGRENGLGSVCVIVGGGSSDLPTAWSSGTVVGYEDDDEHHECGSVGSRRGGCVGREAVAAGAALRSAQETDRRPVALSEEEVGAGRQMAAGNRAHGMVRWAVGPEWLDKERNGQRRTGQSATSMVY